jgi:hypothetical protein
MKRKAKAIEKAMEEEGEGYREDFKLMEWRLPPWILALVISMVDGAIFSSKLTSSIDNLPTWWVNIYA